MPNQVNKTLRTFHIEGSTSMLPKSSDEGFDDLYVNKKCNVALYCRLSEEDKNKQSKSNDSESIQNQKSLLIEYASERNWEIYNIYSDDDYAGADRKRPEFNRLINDAMARKFNIVLCKTQSRFTRELEIVEKYIHGLFPALGIRFISVVDNADTDIKGNKKSRQINGLINEWYLEDMSENIKSVLTNKRKNGLHIGSFAVYGYIKDPNNKGHLLIDTDAAPVVKEIFTLFAKGYGKTAIAQILNDRQIPNPTEYKIIKGLINKQSKGKSSTLWKYFSIANILNCEIYIGHMVQGKYGSSSYKTKKNKPLPPNQWIKVNNTHTPIIEIDLWDKVQSILNEKHKPFTIGKIGIFAKKAICASCGYTMRSSKNHGKHYLKCSTKHVSKDACIGSFISVEALEKAVVSEIYELNSKYIDGSLLSRHVKIKDNEKNKRDKLIDELNEYDKKIVEYSKAIRQAYIDKAKGIISEADYLDFTCEFSKDKNQYEVMQQNTKEALDLMANESASISEKQRIDNLIYIKSLDRFVVDALIDFIIVERKNEGTDIIPIEIHWKF